jgi:hypothetical protein
MSQRGPTAVSCLVYRVALGPADAQGGDAVQLCPSTTHAVHERCLLRSARGLAFAACTSWK